MIGVIANPADHPVIREFFELFKTPWEICRDDRLYDVLLCAGSARPPNQDGKLVVVYAGRRLPFDAEERNELGSERPKRRMLLYNRLRIPIYGDSITFREGTGGLVDEESDDSLICATYCPVRTVVRIGYDLFGEVRTLLTVGQPTANAAIPALDLHIILLRDLIVGSGIPLVEIPPVPQGYLFLACLTHDVDHPLFRRHSFDQTMLGFLYRATAGSMMRVLRGRLRLRGLVRNWGAVLKLPLVHFGLAKDFWREFVQYIQIEKGVHSTFFVIPFQGRPGRTAQGPAPGARGARYGAADIAVQIRELHSAGCEIGLHGIDAWLDSSKCSEELEEIQKLTGEPVLGIRMHWLYLDESSAAALEAAGAAYDSTVGYNETVGYRAGTSQVYKPLNTRHLLELPLHIMDTALFYPSHLNLSDGEAAKRIEHIIDNAVQSGGCVTVNWHDRSIAPERLWGDFYRYLLAKLTEREAWFATAAQAVAWFRKRRSAAFENVSWESDSVTLRIEVDACGDLPDLQLRVYNGRESQRTIQLDSLASEPARGMKRSIDTCVVLS